jgi:hypothetical protein
VQNLIQMGSATVGRDSPGSITGDSGDGSSNVSYLRARDISPGVLLMSCTVIGLVYGPVVPVANGQILFEGGTETDSATGTFAGAKLPNPPLIRKTLWVQERGRGSTGWTSRAFFLSSRSGHRQSPLHTHTHTHTHTHPHSVAHTHTHTHKSRCSTAQYFRVLGTTVNILG